LCLNFRNHTIPIIKISSIPPPRRQYKIPLDPCVFVVEITVAVRSKDEVGETCIISVGETVTVITGIVPLPDSPVAVGTVLGIVSTVGLVVEPGV
jgi:hypothetical protein